ncbi:MAG: hypothetical protein Q9216_004521 [Gyalolechia sp. 2 TL-2023]
MSLVRSSPSEEGRSTACPHSELLVVSSPHAAEIGFKCPIRRDTATRPNKRKRSRDDDAKTPTTFPAPLVLPDDDLALDPRYPPQSLRSWQRDRDRNVVTAERNVIYVAAPPEVDSGVEFVDSWIHPKAPRRRGHALHGSDDGSPLSPNVEDVIDYLSTFYHPLPVRLLQSPLTFAAWDAGSPGLKPPSTSRKPKRKPKSTPSFIALRTSTELVHIRTRSLPGSPFSSQLNLDDLLDVAISILPSDAYALLLLVSHDLYESEDDVFVCGRAYGGSRIAVVSSARYNPDLDQAHQVDRTHSWPASHCKEVVEACCSTAIPSSSKSRKVSKRTESQGMNPSSSVLVPSSPTPASAPALLRPSTPLHLALHHHTTRPPSTSLLYLIRLCLTSAHELGHCFGLDHCVYYACCMQGSASLAEDARQPPYLCPVCEEKVLSATGADGKERMRKLKELCKNWGWGGLEGWLEGMLA